jgi:hypothetical protein
MPILSTDILWKYSTKTGAAGNTTAQATPAHATNGSLGKGHRRPLGRAAV